MDQSVLQVSTPMVQAKYEYEYMSGNGLPSKMLPGDLFTLLRKSNSDWWYVRRDGEKRPIYLPATYLELLPDNAASTAQKTNLIPYARVESGERTSQKRHNNAVSEISDRIRQQVVIPEPDYENFRLRQRPTQLSVTDTNGRQIASSEVAMSPMTDSELSSHSEPSSVSSPEVLPVPPAVHLRPHFTSHSNPVLNTIAKDDWEVHTDSRGRKYYYKPSTNETTWDPPPVKRSPAVSPKPKDKEFFKGNSTKVSLPSGWKEQKSANGSDIFINEQFNEKWYTSNNDRGETYFYSEDRKETGWKLPTEPPSVRRKKGEDTNEANAEIRWRPKPRGNVERTSKTQSVFLPSESQFLMNVHRRHSEVDSKDVHPETASYEKEGYLQRARIPESTKKIKWQALFTVLNGSNLAFFKDHKLKTQTADTMLELWGSEVVFHSEKQLKYTKKSYIELKTATDKEYWLQADSEEETHLWYAAIYGAICSMPTTSQRSLKRQSSNDETSYNRLSDNQSLLHPASSRLPKPENLIEIGKSRADKKKIKNKLKSFITKRPAIETLQKQGIMKEENVFGRRIQALCHQEGTLVPNFVTECIAKIDKSGLKTDGIYRVSGNLSLIQKLRYLVDQEKPVDFSASPWKEDIHVVAGALKLYFRELPEPLVTFDGYNKLIEAFKKQDTKLKLRAFQDVVSSLPRTNQETMKVLIRHLNRVVQHKEHNRMLAQNLAIVFGPTLMWPRRESFNVALAMVFQNQCIEFIINEHLQLFK